MVDEDCKQFREQEINAELVQRKDEGQSFALILRVIPLRGSHIPDRLLKRVALFVFLFMG